VAGLPARGSKCRRTVGIADVDHALKDAGVLVRPDAVLVDQDQPLFEIEH
jgi:hypothetical protein